MIKNQSTRRGYLATRHGPRNPPGQVGLQSLEPRVLLSGTLCAEFVAVNNTSALTGFTTADLEVTTATDWTSAALLLELTQGSIYQDASGGIPAPNPALFGAFPTLAFDTYVDAGANTAFVAGAAGDVGGDVFQFDTTQIDALWFDTATDDLGTLTIGRFTLSDDAVGTWSLRVLNAGGDVVLDSGSFTLGNLATPIPQTPADEADLTGDSKADILWRNTKTGKNTVWQMGGTTFQNAAAIKKLTNFDWQLVGTGDFTGDGKNDLLWRNSRDGRNTVWRMDGTTFQSGIAIKSLTNLDWRIVGVGDFTGDGWADILWRNSQTGKNSVWQMAGTSVQNATAIKKLTNFDWQPAGVSDFTGEGKVDILWRNTADGRNTVWQMNGTTFQGGLALNPLTNFKWQPAMVGDLTGDGKTDILWRNSKNGRNRVWQMDRTSFQAAIAIKRLANLDWQTVGQIASTTGPALTQDVNTPAAALSQPMPPLSLTPDPDDTSTIYTPASLTADDPPPLGLWEPAA